MENNPYFEIKERCVKKKFIWWSIRNGLLSTFFDASGLLSWLTTMDLFNLFELGDFRGWRISGVLAGTTVVSRYAKTRWSLFSKVSICGKG